MGRRTGWFLVAVAGWNLASWTMFAHNLRHAHAAGEDRPRAYWIAHSGLIAVNMVLGAVFAALGVRGLRRSRS